MTNALATFYINLAFYAHPSLLPGRFLPCFGAGAARFDGIGVGGGAHDGADGHGFVQ
jgi:hypothetical protein